MQVAVGILYNSAGELLIAQRPQGKYKGGLWEFPGGKVEPNESSFQALKRELREELGIEVIAADAWLQIQHDYTDRVVLLDAWKVTHYTGEPSGTEGQLIRWIKREDLSLFTFPEGNQLILEKLYISSEPRP